jgi:hypothetical protein
MAMRNPIKSILTWFVRKLIPRRYHWCLTWRDGQIVMTPEEEAAVKLLAAQFLPMLSMPSLKVFTIRRDDQ